MLSMRTPWWRSRLAIAAGLFLLCDLAATMLAAVQWRSTAPGEIPGKPYAALAVLHADTPPSLERTRRALDRALELYLAGRTLRILCIGGNRSSAALNAGDEMRAYLVAGGVAAGDIAVERESYDTRTNLKSLGLTARGMQAGKLAIIAYPAHQPRIRHFLPRQAPEVDAVLIAPRASESFAVVAYETWMGLHHEAVSWALMLLLSDDAYDRLVRAARNVQDPWQGRRH